jgi:hypothetical protein
VPPPPVVGWGVGVGVGVGLVTGTTVSAVAEVAKTLPTPMAPTGIRAAKARRMTRERKVLFIAFTSCLLALTCAFVE